MPELTLSFPTLAGRSAAWQLYDAATGQWLAEGDWGVSDGAFRIPQPEADGAYEVLIASVDEAQGWGYQRGESFLSAEFKVSQGRITHQRQRITTWRPRQLRRLPFRLARFLAAPWKLLFQQRNLLGSMARRDILARYRGSVFGLSWTVLQPLLLMLVYYFVFGVVLQTRFGQDASGASYILYFFAGMLPWLAFSEAVGRAPYTMLENRNFVKKLVFPIDTLPASPVISGLVTAGAAFIIYLFFLMFFREKLPVTALWLPVYWLPQAMFTLGLCWLLASLGVFFRDLAQMIGFLLTLWFFLTPICYSHEALPEEAMQILQRNPIYRLVQGYRLVLLHNTPPDWGEWLRLFVVAITMFYVGYGVFRRLRRNFVDVL